MDTTPEPELISRAYNASFTVSYYLDVPASVPEDQAREWIAAHAKVHVTPDAEVPEGGWEFDAKLERAYRYEPDDKWSDGVSRYEIDPEFQRNN